MCLLPHIRLVSNDSNTFGCYYYYNVKRHAVVRFSTRPRAREAKENTRNTLFILGVLIKSICSPCIAQETVARVLFLNNSNICTSKITRVLLTVISIHEYEEFKSAIHYNIVESMQCFIKSLNDYNHINESQLTLDPQNTVTL
jgi:hypothetical protein